MTSQGDLLTCKIPFSERPGSDQMSKFVLKHPDVKNIITRTLMDTSGDAYRIGDAEWDHGLRSDVLYEPMHVSLDQPPIIVEVQAMSIKRETELLDTIISVCNIGIQHYERILNTAERMQYDSPSLQEEAVSGIQKLQQVKRRFEEVDTEEPSNDTTIDHFALTDKQFAYNRYARILKKYIKDEVLETNFKIWKKSDFIEDYWIKKIHSSIAKKSKRNAALHIQKSVINEYSQLDKYLERESTLSDTTTNESEYTESEQHYVYRLTFDELNDNSLKSSTSNILTYTLNTINIDQKRAHQKQHIVKKSEPDFITKYVTNFLQNIMFAYQDHLFFRWDISSKVYDESKKKKRPDFIICTSDGFEVGCGEIKPPDTNSNEEKEDRCRIPEHLKKQLHMRLQVALEEKELVTFGFSIFGEELELSMMEFKEGKYEYSIIKLLKLPTMYATFERMDESVEYLLGFFDIIKSTVVEKNGSANSSLFMKYKKLLKPTISFE
ncbi:hypothetical protein G6F62_006250 [Rhizopus arrhizus]|nr:hypothetical protein G6F62_006250 [Rhizopus arrhizus]